MEKKIKTVITKIILFLKNLEFSLSEVDTYMKNKNTNNLLKMLDEKEADIDHKIQLLQNLKISLSKFSEPNCLTSPLSSSLDP